MKDVYQKPIVVAEIGCNHQGSLEVALELVELAQKSGATYAKFQKRNNKTLLTEDQFRQPHPFPYNAFGNTYGEHRENLELTVEEHSILKEYCESKNIGYSTSVWDEISAYEIIALKPDYIKVPSACNYNFKLLDILLDEYKGDVHISLGMTTVRETNEILNHIKTKEHALSRIVLYACTSGYPIKFEEVCLLEIQSLRKRLENQIKSIGFSGHHLGIAIDIAAFTLGATWIERHFTKDRTWKGTDHAASLEPGGLTKLVRDLQAAHAALKYKPEQMLEVELEQRNKLKYKRC